MVSPVLAWVLTWPLNPVPSAARSGMTCSSRARPPLSLNLPMAGSKLGSGSILTPPGPSTFGPRSVRP